MLITEIIDNKLFERVHPCLVKKDSYIANVSGVMNAVILHGEPVGESVLQGEGAGPGPTSSALISDLCSILSGNIKYPFGMSYSLRKKIGKFNILNRTCSAYLRIEVKDQPGVLSSITKIFAKNKISIKVNNLAHLVSQRRIILKKNVSSQKLIYNLKKLLNL